jgi:hypothetical protein
MVQVAVAGDLTEAEELQTILHTAGIDCEIEQAVEQHPEGHEDAPVRVLVAESDLDDAQEAIEALTDPEDLYED